MSLIENIENWATKLQTQFFIYRDGFYEVPYLANTPESIIKSLKKLPFVEHQEEQHIISKNNPLAKAELYYAELCDGLHFYFSQYRFKTKVRLKPIFDRSMICDYYHLSFYLIQTDEIIEMKKPIIKGQRLGNLYWALFKPYSGSTSHHFPGSFETYCTLYFNKDWYNKNLANREEFKRSNLISFFESDTESLFWPAQNSIIKSFYLPIEKIFLDSHIHFKNNIKTIEDLCIKALFDFLDLMGKQNRVAKYIENTNINRKKIELIENILMQYLFSAFPGIQYLAKEVGISPTKLKTDFKSIHGMPIYQYYRQLQMKSARQLLKKGDLNIKNIAQLFSYESASKFSLAFREVHGISPAEAKQEK